MYRPKVDTVAPPPIRYEAIEDVAPAPKPAPKKEEVKPVATQQNNTAKPATINNNTKPASQDKPKPKKVIVE